MVQEVKEDADEREIKFLSSLSSEFILSLSQSRLAINLKEEMERNG